jgi:hypothetical protein
MNCQLCNKYSNGRPYCPPCDRLVAAAEKEFEQWWAAKAWSRGRMRAAYRNVARASWMAAHPIKLLHKRVEKLEKGANR